MKKIILIAAILVSVAACKKNYNCNCTNPAGTSTFPVSATNGTKAKTQCDTYTSPSTSTTCTIQ